MPTLLAIPLLTLAVMVQSAILSQVTLLRAPPDLVLVTVTSWAVHERVQGGWTWAVVGGLVAGFVSELPVWVFVGGYLVVAGIAAVLKKRVWGAPLLALLTAVLLGTVTMHGLAFATLRALGTPINPVEAINLIVLPSLLLNILVAIPIQGLVETLAGWLFPAEMEM